MSILRQMSGILAAFPEAEVASGPHINCVQDQVTRPEDATEWATRGIHAALLGVQLLNLPGMSLEAAVPPLPPNAPIARMPVSGSLHIASKLRTL